MPKAKVSAKKMAAHPAHRRSVLEQLRKDRGLTQQQLADRVHTSQAQIDRLEKGLRSMRKPWAMRLAPVLDTHWLVLMGEEPPTLSPEEQALISLYRGLSESDRDTVYKVAELAHEKAKVADSK